MQTRIMTIVLGTWFGVFSDSRVVPADPIMPVLKSDEAILTKLKVFGENQTCLLVDPKVIEDLSDFAKGWHRMQETGPTGRDFTLKMAWMPDRKRAFFYGAIDRLARGWTRNLWGVRR